MNAFPPPLPPPIGGWARSRQFGLTASPLRGDLRANAILGGLEPARLFRNERRDASMNRENLVVLHAAMSTVLAWPPAVLDEIARWLAPAAAKPNGHDPHPPNGKDLDPPPIASLSPRSPAKPLAGKTRHGRSPAAAKTDERLLGALRDAPGLSAVKLAAAVRINRSTVGDRLRELAGRELVEKDDDGRWRLAGDESRPTGPL
jgi:DNA-binding transcriptional ArsR family regulator